MRHHGFSHIGLSTLDLDKTREFYEEVLGFRPVVADTIRDELRGKGVEVTELVDHGWCSSLYFKDPNGVSLEYCCPMRDLTEDDARMQERFTIPRAALDLGLGDRPSSLKAQSSLHKATCPKG
jgi:catechol 2,3-dioxygenase-like lactoylglutathione lyase family enzyme